MAGRIAGITIVIDGDTTKLQSALKGVDSQLKTTQSNLKDINKLLKLDPSNTELLTQKQKNLESAISATKERLSMLKDAQKDVAEGSAEWDTLQREIIATEQSLKSLEQQQREFGSVASQQIKAAGAAMQGFGDKVSAAGQKMKGISTAASGALAGLAGMAYKSVTAADELNTLSKQTGLTTSELQKMKYASDFVDVTLEDMTGALTKTKKAMTGNDALWEQLGVSVKNADGSMRDATDVFYDSLEALSKVENETERDQLAMQLFGKSADKLAGIIDDGGAALKKYGKEAEDLGVILGEDTVDDLNEIKDTLDKLKKQGGAALAKLGATVAKVLAPALDKGAKLIDKISEKLSKLTPKQTETIMKILAVVAAIAPLLSIGGKLIKVVGSITSVVGTVVGVLGGPLTLAIGAVIAIGVLLYKNWDKIKETAINLYTNLKATWANIKSALSSTMENIKTSLSNAWTNIKTTASNAANAVKTSVSNAWNNVKNVTSTAWDGVKSVLSNKWNAIKSAYEAHGGGLKGVASAAVEGIKQYFTLGFDTLNSLLGGRLDTLKSKISTAFETVKTTIKNAIDKIKSLFNFSWSLPNIKLPHFRVTGGKWPYGLGGEGYLPSISIDWYKKAYNNPMLFKSPTVLATPNGYKGFGDGHGAEIVLGLNKLRELVGAAGVTINVYASGNQSAEEIAYKVQDILVQQQMQRSRAYA